MRCPTCAATAPADARWCGACGAALRPTDRAGAEEPDGEDMGGSATEGRLGRVTAAAVVIAVLGGLLVWQTTAPEPVVPAGFNSRGDGARTGVVSATTVPPPQGVAWRSPVDVPLLVSLGADVLGVTEAGGREVVVVYDPAEDGHRVTTHDAADGEVLATTMLPLGNQPLDTSIADGLLAHRSLARVTLVDIATGEHRWTVEERLREDTQVTPFGVVGVPADADGLEVVLLSLEDGSEVWRAPFGVDGRVTDVLGTDTVIVIAGEDDRGAFMYGLDPTTGRTQWQVRDGPLLERNVFPRAAPVTDGRSVLVAGLGTASLVDATDGRVTPVLPSLPEDPDAAPLRTPPITTAALGQDLVVVSDGSGQVSAIDIGGDTPRLRWATDAHDGPVFSLAVADGLVAVRCDCGTTLLDAATGSPVAQVGPAGGTARLAMTGDGAVARVTDDATVELIGRDGPVWESPTVAPHLPDLATDAGAVAVTTPDGVQVHDTDSGERRFAHSAFDPGQVTASSLTAPALLGGRVALAPPLNQPPARGGLLALFADTGIVDWARDQDQVPPRGSPVIDRDLLVLPVGDQLLGFDRRNGRRVLVVHTRIARADLAASGGWLVTVDHPRDGGDLWVGRRSSRDLVFRAPIRVCTPPVIHGEVTIVANHLGDILARRLEDGEQPWGERAGGSVCRPLSIAGDTLVALVDDRELLGVSLGDGDAVWRIELPAVAAGAPVVGGGQVLVPTLAGEVLAYDVNGAAGPDGPAWRVEVGGTPAGAVAVDGDTVIVVTREGELVGLR